MTNRKLAFHPLHSLLSRGFARAAAGALGAAAPLMALANPTGGQVVAGSATIHNAGHNGTVINQSSQNAIIDWQQFNVGKNQYVQFVQPDSSAVILNRVIGGTPSQIFGDIKANGQVFLVNTNGIYFARGATLDAQGLVASTLDINNSDFMAGRYLFTEGSGNSGAGVDNQGRIQVGRGGYVVLQGDYTQNQGSIDAQFGKVYLAAGGATTLTLGGQGLISYTVDSATLSRLAGVNNAGEITALGGSVVMTADVANALTASAVNNSGLIAAHSVRQSGGEIVLEAVGGGIYNSGHLDASAVQNGVAGGTVILHGDGRTELAPSTLIDVSGDGGKGGFIDLSGTGLHVRGMITTGKGGNLLLDPSTINIVAGAASGAGTGATNSVGTGFIDSKLNAGSNVEIVASHTIKRVSGTGINATGSGNLTIEIGHVACATGICVGGTTSVSHATGSINLTGLPINIGGNLAIDAAFAFDAGGQITTGNLTANTVNLTATQVTVNGNITATGGDVAINAHSDAPLVTVTGTITANNGAFKASFSNEGGAGIGSITLHNVTAQGIFVMAGHITDTGTLHAKGSGEAGSRNRDVQLHAEDRFDSHGGANINVGKIISDHGNINVTTSGTGASTIATGPLSAVNGSVDLFTSGNTATAGGGITVTGDIHGSHVGINARSIGAGATVTVNGNIVATEDFSDSVVLSADQLGGVGAAKVKVTGAITAAKGVRIHAQGSSANNAITLGAITANTLGCPSSDCNGASVSIDTGEGTINANGTITLDKDAFKQGGVSLTARVVNVANINAPGGSISISAHTFSSVNHAAITQTAGTTLNARDINIDLTASYGGNITLANLTASSSKAGAHMDVRAISHNAANHIIVNGNITVSGKTTTASFSSAMPGDGVPVSASLNMQASGSAGAAHTIKINGTTTVTAHAGAFNLHHTGCSGECGPNAGPTILANGNGGAAVMTLFASGSHGNISLGAVTLKGPDAELQVGAHAITTGNITVTGSGQTASLNVSNGGGNSFASNNNVGRATVELEGSGHGSSGAATIATGNINVTGKGSALVAAQGQAITAGNITVTATAATSTRRTRSGTSGSSFKGFGLGTNLPGLFGLEMSNGSFNAGRATVALGASLGSNHSQPSAAQTIKVGNVNVNGVGEADINLSAHAITAGSLTAIATAGKMKGSFSSGGEAGHFHQTFNINGGEANIQLDGGSASNTVITVNGGVAATGPTAGVNMFGGTIKVTKGISVAGAGGQVTFSGSGTGGAGSHQTFKGPGPITGITLGGEGNHDAVSIAVGGTVSAKGKGIIGIAITGQKVVLGGLSASASNVATYKVTNTSGSTNDAFTAGSAGIVVFQEKAGVITGPATINGNVTVSAPHGNVTIASQLNATGQVTVTAAGNITDSAITLLDRIGEISNVTGRGGSSNGPNISSFVIPVNLSGAGISMIATAGSIDLTGATVTTPTTGVAAFKAGKDIILSGVDITVGTLVAYAGSTIHNGGGVGTIDANAVAFHAGKDLTLSSTDITVGSGAVPQDATTVNGNAALKAALADTTFAATLGGDGQLATGLAQGGIPFTSVAPNAAFVAGGAVSLGGLTLKGGYLYLQGTNVTLGSAVTAPKGLVVQVAPSTATGTIDLEGKGATGSNLNVNDTGFLDQFADGTTLVLGASGSSGNISLGNNGTFDIGSDNLILDTSGTVTGLGNVTSTGIVSSLEALLGSAVVPPTAGEIDPTSSTVHDPGEKKHQNPGNEDAGANGTQGGGITQDTSGSSACH